MLVLSGCATNPTSIQTSYTEPARSQEATKLRRVAVIPFTPMRGDDVTPNIELVLAEAKVDGMQFYTVVERAKLDATFTELRLAASGVLDPNTVSRVGKVVGANGVYTGAVTKFNVTNQPYAENRSACAYYVNKTDKKGKSHQECGGMREWTVQCTKRTATYAFIPKLIGVESAVIKYSREAVGVATSSACPDSGVGLKDGQELLSAAKDAAINEFRADVTPHTVRTSLVLLEDDQFIKAESSKTAFKMGVTFAKGGRLDRACEIWSGINESASPDLLYNQGLCTELLGNNLTDASALYVAADRLTTKPVPAIGAALGRVAKKQEDNLKLASQALATQQEALKQSQQEAPVQNSGPSSAVKADARKR